MKHFEHGDTVQLKSGGPVMTVAPPSFGSWYPNFTNPVRCLWFDSGSLHDKAFELVVLQKVSA